MEKANNTRKKILWITRTGVLIAMLVTLQWSTAGTQAFAGQYITGSLVNFTLAMAAMFAGLWSGLAVALLSPFCAYLLGIGPALIQIVPCIALGNCVYVVLLWLFTKKWCYWKTALGIAAAATAKFVTLYVAVVKVLIPVMGTALKAPQVQKFTAMFSVPQLITALIGGVLALSLAPVIRKAIQK